MQIGVPRESRPRETRVAATPKTVGQLVGLGYDVAVESGAGALASFSDEAYAAAGARVVDAGEAWALGHRAQGQRPQRRRDRAAAAGHGPRLAHGAGAEPGAGREAACG